MSEARSHHAIKLRLVCKQVDPPSVAQGGSASPKTMAEFRRKARLTRASVWQRVEDNAFHPRRTSFG